MEPAAIRSATHTLNGPSPKLLSFTFEAMKKRRNTSHVYKNA
ncbi:hypothetical protein VHA_002544 [Grimontia hollisae CIP 101886]|uniref:Uncharacterized protein n=1 Tax=Grimontia hollisae CIP 101886 TaxID=675812 RepID=D0I9K7_GRIHO|nr:hypothetical protein VHA_002544 [Grimontia hollisae CIP 101886]